MSIKIDKIDFMDKSKHVDIVKKKYYCERCGAKYEEKVELCKGCGRSNMIKEYV